MPDLPPAGVALTADGAKTFFSDVDRAGQAVNAFGASTDDAAKQVDHFADTTRQIKIDSLTSKLEAQQRELGILGQELDKTKAKYGDASTQAQRKELALQKLTSAIKITERQLEAEQQALKAAENATEQLTGAVDKGGRSFDTFGEMVSGAARRVGEIAVNALMEAGQAVLAFAGQSLQMAGSYEKSMDVLQVQSGATDTQMQQLKDTAKALGADLTLPATSAVDAGNAMLELSKGGLSVEDAMAAARGTLQLAAAAETDVATAANITTGALQAFGLEGDKAAYIADVLANAANESRASVTDLSQGFQQAAFRFKSAGQGADDLAASLAILTNNGLSGSDAGTALQNMLARLQAPTDKAADLMKELGINVYDAKGNMLPMPQIIGVFNKALGGMTQAQRNNALSTILLGDGMKAMIPLLGTGAEGFDKMKASVNQQGAAAALAQAQTAGMLGAIAGLQSQIETLMLEALEPLLPVLSAGIGQLAAFAGSFVGQVGPAVTAGIGLFQQISAMISEVALPALSGLTAALAAYALVQTVQAIPAILASIPALVAQTAAFIANAAAVGVALAPYALIAVAIGGVAKAWQDFNTKIKEATQRLLESKPFWTDSTAALETYGNANQEAQGKLASHAKTIEVLRSQIEGEIESLGRRMAAGEVSEGQYQKEMGAINRKADSLRVVTDDLNKEIEALNRQEAASLTATQKIEDQANAHPELDAAINLTIEELQKLADQIEETYKKGAEAVQGYASKQSDYLSDVEDRQSTHKDKIEKLNAEMQAATTDEQRKGIQERIDTEMVGYANQEKEAAVAYAEQQAAQRRHLGQMLIDYTVNQTLLGNISREKGAEITAGLEKEFGLQETSTASTFLKMTGSIDAFAASGNEDVSSLTKTLNDQAQQAADTQKAMDDYAKEYAAKAVSNFIEEEGNAKDLVLAVEKIPAQVQSKVESNAVEIQRKVDELNAAIGRIPRNVHINITADTPPQLTAESPTPFEEGLWGIGEAFEDLTRSVIPFFNDALADAGENADELLDQMKQALQTIADMGRKMHGVTAGLLGGQANIFRQQAGNIGALAEAEKNLDPRVYSNLQGSLQRALETSKEFTDPRDQAAYYDLVSRQAYETADLQQQWFEALEAGDQAALLRLDEQMKLIEKAQNLEKDAFRENLKAQKSDILSLYEEVQALIASMAEIGIPPELTEFYNKLLEIIKAMGIPIGGAGGGPTDPAPPPMPTTLAGPTTINNFYGNTGPAFNLGVNTSQSPNVVINNFYTMRALAA